MDQRSQLAEQTPSKKTSKYKHKNGEFIKELETPKKSSETSTRVKNKRSLSNPVTNIKVS